MIAVIDRWQYADRYLVGFRNGEARFVTHDKQKLVGHSAIASAAVVSFDEVRPLPGQLDVRATYVPRLAAVARRYARESERAFVLSIGEERARAGIVAAGRVESQEETPELTLRSMWLGFVDEHPHVRHFLEESPGVAAEAFRGFCTAVTGGDASRGPVPFIGRLDLTFLHPAVARVFARIDPRAECGLLVLTDWAGTTVVREMAMAALGGQGGRDIPRVPCSAEPFHDAVEGAFRMRSDEAERERQPVSRGPRSEPDSPETKPGTPEVTLRGAADATGNSRTGLHGEAGSAPTRRNRVRVAGLTAGALVAVLGAAVAAYVARDWVVRTSIDNERRAWAEVWPWVQSYFKAGMHGSVEQELYFWHFPAESYYRIANADRATAQVEMVGRRKEWMFVADTMFDPTPVGYDRTWHRLFVSMRYRYHWRHRPTRELRDGTAYVVMVWRRFGRSWRLVALEDAVVAAPSRPASRRLTR